MKTTKKEAKKKIVEKLHALSSKFPIAEDLIEAIGKFGLFSCEAHRDCYGRWHLSPYIAYIENKRRLWDEAESYYIDEGRLCFVCIGMWKWWYTRLRNGRHFVLLQFDIEDGSLIKIVPDKEIDSFWKGKTTNEKRKEIRNLIKAKEKKCKTKE